MGNNDKIPLKIKRRGDDDYQMISVRIKKETLAKIDGIAAETNYSRNELINVILSYGTENIVIE